VGRVSWRVGGSAGEWGGQLASGGSAGEWGGQLASGEVSWRVGFCHKKIYQSFESGDGLSIPKFGDILSPTYWGRVVQGTVCLGDVSSRGRLVQGMVHPGDTSLQKYKGRIVTGTDTAGTLRQGTVFYNFYR
jgi:hypothetical protein